MSPVRSFMLLMAARIEVKILLFGDCKIFFFNRNILSLKNLASVGFHVVSLHLFEETLIGHIFNVPLSWVEYEHTASY